MKYRKMKGVLALLAALILLTGCAEQDGFRIERKDASLSGAILYTLEGNTLQYDVFCQGNAAGAAITDETGTGIDSLEKLAALLGTADAPAPVTGTEPGARTIGKAVTADIVTDSRGKIISLVIRSVSDRPVIGISWKNDTIGEDYRGFAEALERNGALAVYLPLTISPEHAQLVLAELDGLFVTGGEDWNPALYGEMPVPHGSVDCNDIRDASDLYLIREALARDLPMLCICRGAQGLNIALGGGLIQDIPSHLGQKVAAGEIPEARISKNLSADGCGCEDQTHLRVQIDGIVHEGNTYHELKPGADGIGIDPGSKWLHDLFGTDTLEWVSTAHHQAIDPERLGEGLFVAAVSADGIIEAVECREKLFVLGLQWHPERDALEDSQNTGVDRTLSNIPLRALAEYAEIYARR